MPGPASLDDEVQKKLLQELEDYFTRGGQAPPDASHGDRALRVATAALLLETARADLVTRHDEHRAIALALERVLLTTAEETAALVRSAEQDIVGRRPLRDLTAAIAATFTRVDKRRLVEGLWRVALADAEILGHEEYLIRKISELIQLPFEDFLRAKIEAKEAFFGEGRG